MPKRINLQSLLNLLIIVFGFLLFTALARLNPTYAIAFTRSVFLQNVTPNSAELRWKTDTNASVTVNYGSCTSPFYGSSVVSDNREFTNDHAKFTGLSPNTRYCYQLVSAGTALTPAGDQNYNIKTPPLVGSTTPFTFAIWGDSGNGSSNQIAVATQVNTKHPDLVMVAGDVGYPYSTDFNNNNSKYFNIYKNTMRFSPFYSDCGNHETSCPTLIADHSLPQDPQHIPPVAPGRAAGIDSTYSWDWGNVHFTALNSNLNITYDQTKPMSDPANNSAPQIKWAYNDIIASNQPWKIMIWHHNGWSSGTHSTLTNIVNNLIKLAQNTGVDIAFWGHSHVYERFSRYPANGPIYYTIGNGGQSSSTPSCGQYTNGPRCLFSTGGVGFLLAEVNGNQMTVRYFNGSGQNPDTATYNADSSIGVPTPTPGTVSPSPTRSPTPSPTRSPSPTPTPGTGVSPTPIPTRTPSPSPSSVAGCTTSSNGAWQNVPIPTQTGAFTVEFNATPNNANLDGAIGLSNGSVSAYTSLAAIPRFYTNNLIDARNGSVYQALTQIPYTAGTAYHFRLNVNIPTHTYSAYVKQLPSGTEQTIGTNFAFRTEQANVASLNNLGIRANTGSGSITVCNVAISATINPSPQVSPTSIPGSSASPGSQTANVFLKLKFQGITQVRPNKQVELGFRKNGQWVTSRISTFTADANGFYTNPQALTGLTPDTYDLYIKAPVYLIRRFSPITLNPGNNNLDFSGTPFLAGDIYPNDTVDIFDYAQLLTDFGPRMPPGGSIADLDFDGDVDITDYAIIVFNFNKVGDDGGVFPSPPTASSPNSSPIASNVLTPTPRATPGVTPQPTPIISTSPTPAPSGPPPSTPPSSSKGIWISPAEIAQLPISGQGSCTSGTLCYEAWNSILSQAQTSICSSTPNMDVYDGKFHARCVYKTALAAVRLRTEPGRTSEAQRYYDKTVVEMKRVMGTEKEALANPDGSGGLNDGSLAIARNWPQYLISGDILGLYPDGNPNSFATVWGNYVAYMYRSKFTFRVGDGGFAFNSGPRPSCASNGCIMGAQAGTMTAVYMGDKAKLDGDWLQFQRYTGNQTVGNPISFSSTGDAWYHNMNAKSPVNPKGSFCANGTYPADGAIPNDQGRGGSCPSNPNSAPGYTQYPWQGMQGAYAQAMVLDRLGYKDSQGRNPWQVNDQALLRTAQYQWYLQNKFGGSWYTSGTDAHWVRHLAYLKYNFRPISYKASGLSENIDLTAWTHPKL